MTSLHALNSPTHRLLARTKSLAGTALSEVRRWWRVVLTWHRQRLATDPLYPVAITTAGGALISVCVTSTHFAHLLRTALHLLAGHPVPPLAQGRTSESALWDVSSDYAEDYYGSGGQYA